MRFNLGGRYIEFKRVPIWRHPYWVLVFGMIGVLAISTQLGPFWGQVFTIGVAILVLRYWHGLLARGVAWVYLAVAALQLIATILDTLGFYLIVLVPVAVIGYLKRSEVTQWFRDRI